MTYDPIMERDPVVEAYKRHVDRTLIRQALKMTPDQRVRELIALVRAAEQMRKDGRAR